VDRRVVRQVAFLSRVVSAESGFHRFLREFVFPLAIKLPFLRARMVATISGLDHEQESVGLEQSIEAFPSLRHGGLRCTELRDGAGLVMHRSAPEGSASGWFVGCNRSSHDHNHPDHLQMDSLYAIVRSCPMALPYLALPPESYVEQEPEGRPSIYFQEKQVSFKKGSYLDAKYGRGGFWSFLRK
jgi:hypothetical protein